MSFNILWNYNSYIICCNIFVLTYWIFYYKIDDFYYNCYANENYIEKTLYCNFPNKTFAIQFLSFYTLTMTFLSSTQNFPNRNIHDLYNHAMIIGMYSIPYYFLCYHLLSLLFGLSFYSSNYNNLCDNKNFFPHNFEVLRIDNELHVFHNNTKIEVLKSVFNNYHLSINSQGREILNYSKNFSYYNFTSDFYETSDIHIQRHLLNIKNSDLNLYEKYNFIQPSNVFLMFRGNENITKLCGQYSYDYFLNFIHTTLPLFYQYRECKKCLEYYDYSDVGIYKCQYPECSAFYF